MKVEEESGNECKPEFVEANEVIVDYRTSSSRRIKRPKTLEDYYTPFVNEIESKITLLRFFYKLFTKINF